jgi:FtsP/CotA-like multicopper oxidase with cupredoxin domain
VRLRVINASADTAYRLAVGGHKLTVTHADGFPVVPVEVDAFLIGMGERCDVTLTVASGAWPVIALAEGKANRAAAMLRTRDTPGGADVRFEAKELDGKWLRYADRFAHERVRLQPSPDITNIVVSLTGGMARSDWGIGGKTYAERDPIAVEEGRWYSLAIRNDTTMWHPVHLHGHTAQMGRAEGGVRKDTVNVLPGGTTELVFLPTTPASGCCTATTHTISNPGWRR